jgi:preflagellin peptidase FlaK
MQELFSFAAFGFSIAGLLVATHSDLKERLVSDKVSYGMLIIGLALFFGNALLYGEWEFLAWSVGASIGMFLLGYLLWRTGFWAGGDVKLFTGLAALNPVNWIAIAKIGHFSTLGSAFNAPVFPLTLFLASVLALLPVGIVLLAGKALKQPEKFRSVFSNPKERLLSIVFSAFLLSAVSFWLEGNQSVLAGIGIPSLAVIAGFLIGIGLIEKKTRSVRWLKTVLSIGLLVAGTWFWGIPFLVNAAELFVVLTVLAFLFSLFFSNQLFRSSKAVEKLREGDIPAVTIVETEKGINVRKEPGFWQTIKNLEKQEWIVQRPEREICSRRRAGGLEKEQIQEIQRLAEKGMIPKTIEVKESAAFVPAVLVAYVLLNALGDPWGFLI